MLSRVVVAHPSKEELANDCTGKGDGCDILLGGRLGVLRLVESLQDGVDLANDPRRRRSEGGLLSKHVRLSLCSPVQVAIREKSGTASNGWPTAFPSTFLEVLQRFTMDVDFIAHGRVINLLR